MVDEMRLPTFRGDGYEDPDQHWFLCEFVWSIKNVTDEAVKRAQFSTTLRDHALRWLVGLRNVLFPSIFPFIFLHISSPH
jgi:hypothetical protein